MVLRRVKCPLNRDVENFLWNNACDFEQRNLSRTSLVVTRDANANNKLIFLGYFSVSIHVLRLPEGISNRLRQNLSGGNKNVESVPSFLIGQLAKNDEYKTLITGSDLLDYALATIREARKLVGGRVVVVECNHEPKLRNFYTANGFKYLGDNPANGLAQFFLKLR